jgi:TolB-like protein
MMSVPRIGNSLLHLAVRALPGLLVALLLSAGGSALAASRLAARAAASEVEPPVMSNMPGTNELQAFIFSKMEYDHFYFKRIEEVKERGGRYKDLTVAQLDKESERARVYVPILDEFFHEIDEYKAGKPFHLPPTDPAFRVYMNLIAILDMFQAYDRHDYKTAVEYGARVVIDRRENLGLFRGETAEYYLALYRHFFYLMSASYYNQGKYDAAVEWLVRIEADTDLQKLKAQIATRTEGHVDKRAERIAELRNRPLAVMAFGNLTKNPADDWIGPGTAELLSVDLSRHSDLFVVERSQIAAVQSEMRLSQLGITNDNDATQMGKMLNAGSILVGSYQVAGSDINFHLKLIDADDGQVLAAAEGKVIMAELVPGVRTLAIAMLRELGWVDSVNENELSAAHAPRPDTVRDLMQARLLMATKADEAKALYAKAIREDPAYANLFADLQNRFAGLAATVGILPFINISGDEEDSWMVRGVAEALATDLPKMSFTVVERTQLETVLKTEATGQIISINSAQEIGRKAGADFVVLGSILHQKPLLRIDARFVEVKTGIVVTSSSADNQTDNFAAALATLSSAIAKSFNESLGKDTIEKLAGNSMSTADFEKYIRQQLSKEGLQKSMALNLTEPPPPPKAELPLTSRWWFWTSVGVSVGGAVAAGIVAAQRASSKPINPNNNGNNNNNNNNNNNGQGSVTVTFVGTAPHAMGATP